MCDLITGGIEFRLTFPSILQATLFQAASVASMQYAAPSETLSGICNLQSPVALCTLNVYETGSPLPSTGLVGRVSSTTKSSSTNRDSSAITPTIGSLKGLVLAMGTMGLGFCISVALMR